MTALNTDFFVGDSDALPAIAAGKCYVLHAQIDASKNNISAADIVKLWNVPAGTYIEQIWTNVTTVEDSTCTVTLGDYLVATPTTEVDADGYDASINMETAAASSSRSAGAAYAAGKFYRDATAYIGLLFNNAADTVVVDVFAICYDCRN